MAFDNFQSILDGGVAVKKKNGQSTTPASAAPTSGGFSNFKKAAGITEPKPVVNNPSPVPASVTETKTPKQTQVEGGTSSLDFMKSQPLEIGNSNSTHAIPPAAPVSAPATIPTNAPQVIPKRTVTPLKPGAPIPSILRLDNPINQKPQETISAAPVDTRPEDTFWSRLGRAILPQPLAKELGITEQQRKPTQLTDIGDIVRNAGTAQTIAMMEKHPDQVDPQEYLRRGMSFGNNLDVYQQYQDLMKGYHTDVAVTDLPEPVTVKQKVFEAIGNTIAMYAATPLIEGAAAGLVAKIPGGAKALTAVEEATKLKPWSVGYPLAVAKQGAIGGLFGLITNNKNTVAENVTHSAGMFAGFTALAYPIQMFFRPIIESVGTAKFTPNQSNVLTDPAVTQEPIAKTLWFTNPKDDSQLLKVTANGVRFVPKNSAEVVAAGSEATNATRLTDLDIEAFKVKPSLYDELSTWIKGKKPTVTEVPFTVKDNMPRPDAEVFTTQNPANNPATDLTSSELRNEIANITQKMSAPGVTTESVAQMQTNVAPLVSALEHFHGAAAQPNVTVNDPTGARIANISTIEYSDGQYAAKIDATTPNYGVKTDFNQSKLYPSEEKAVAAAKEELISWAKDTNKMAEDPADKAAINTIIAKVNGVQSQVADVASQVEDIQNKIVLQDNDLHNRIMFELENAQAGKRIAVPNIDTAGYTFSRQASTFPKWIPENLRRKPLLDAVSRHIMEGTVPTKVNEKRLYDVVAQEMRAMDQVVNDQKFVESQRANLFDPFATDEENAAALAKFDEAYAKLKAGQPEAGQSAVPEPSRTPFQGVDKPVQAEAVSPEEVGTAIAQSKGAEVADPLAGIENDIPLQSAIDAHRGTSFDPEKRAAQRVKEYVQQMTEDYKTLEKFATTPEKKAILDREFAKLRAGFKSRELAALAADARTMSPMITGRGNFPVASNNKKMESAMNKWKELFDFEKKMMKRIENELNPSTFKGTSEKTIDEMGSKLQELKDLQAKMKAANKVIRSGKNVEEGLRALGYADKDIEALQKPDFAGRTGFAGFQITSINNKIKTLEARSKETAAKREKANTTGNETIEAGDTKIVKNFDDNRVQIEFNGKPSPEIIASLKAKGFRWSPFNKAWQRVLTDQAVRDAQGIVGTTKELSPVEIEAKADALPVYTGGGENADIGVFQDGTPVELGSMDMIRPIEMPEMVRLARELTGAIPNVKMKMGKKLGYFSPGQGQIYLKADQFARGNEAAVAKLLAHEIGHLVDWLPDKTMARGNLLGRIHSLRQFMKSTFGGSEVGLFGKQNVDLQKLHNDAFKGVLKKSGYTYGQYITTKAIRDELKPQIKTLYNQLVEETGAIKNADVKKELSAVSEYWRPYDKENSDARYLAYRENPKELYADAISVLFNSPGTLEKMAPTFYKEFFAALDAKPEVKAAYFETQELLNGSTEAIFKARKEDIRNGFARAEDLQSDFDAKKKLAKVAYWERLRQQLDDINYPILKKQKMAEANGVVLPDSENPKFILQEQSLVDNENFLLVEHIDKQIVKPIEAAGMTVEDIGEYLLLDRIQTERADIANPFGFNPTNAAKQMEHLKESVGEKNFALLQEKVQDFHNLIFQSVEEAANVGSYNREMFDTKIKPNKDHYASFQVVDYLQDYVPATVKAQVGTLKEVANPFVSTILKTVALNRLNALQRAKNATIKLLQNNFPEEIAETKRITDGKLSIFKPARDKGAIELLVDGKMKSYDVDPYIAESFKRDKVGDLNIVVSLIDKFNNKLFKPMVTSYNLGFALAFNPMRDFQRNYKLIPNATIGNLLKAYVQSLPSAIRFAKGDLDAFTRSLVESKAMNVPIGDFAFDPREDELGRILERYGIVKANEPYNNKVAELARKTILKPVAQVLEGIRFIADSFESISKIAGAKVRIAGGEQGKQLAYNLRNFTGTPNYKVRGKQTSTTNALFVFSNIAKEGMKADFRFATDPKTRSGYWFKTVKISLLPKFLMFLASAGALGITAKKFFDNVSEYDKSNYIILPVGFYNGKSEYIRIPHDETGRLMASVFWKIANAVKDGGKGKDLQDIFSIGAGQLPSVTPAISIGSGWLQYLSGKNPYDSFRGRNVIDDTTFTAGGGAALKKMVEWTTNSLGITKFSTFDTSKQTGLETFIQVAPLFSSVLKISDYGQQEKLKEIGADVAQKTAQKNLEDRDLIDKYVKKAREEGTSIFNATKYKNAIVKEGLGGHFPKSKEEAQYADNLMLKFTRALKAGKNDDPRVAAIISSTSNAQKREIIKSIKSDMSDEEFKKFKAGLIRDKIVTPELLFNLK